LKQKKQSRVMIKRLPKVKIKSQKRRKQKKKSIKKTLPDLKKSSQKRKKRKRRRSCCLLTLMPLSLFLQSLPHQHLTAQKMKSQLPSYLKSKKDPPSSQKLTPNQHRYYTRSLKPTSVVT